MSRGYIQEADANADLVHFRYPDQRRGLPEAYPTSLGAQLGCGEPVESGEKRVGYSGKFYGRAGLTNQVLGKQGRVLDVLRRSRLDEGSQRSRGYRPPRAGIQLGTREEVIS
jgi:hypothetical protein